MGVSQSIDSVITSIIEVFSNIRNPISETLGDYSIWLFLLGSFVLGLILIKKFIMTPLTKKYILWYIIISLMIFLILKYL